MSAIEQVFEGHTIRVQLDERGDPWFCAKDVCDATGVKNVPQAILALDADEVRICSTYTNGGPRGMIHVSEAGLYSLVMRSRKKEAKRFKRWVTHEVLPSIRKTGSYSKPSASLAIPATFLEALEAAATVERERLRLAAVVEEQAPKVEAHDRFLDTSDNFTLTHLAKSCGTTVRKLNDWLRSAGYLHKSHKDNPPNDIAIQRGLLVVVNREYSIVDEDGSERHTRPQTRVTPLGMTVLSAEYAALSRSVPMLAAGGSK